MMYITNGDLTLPTIIVATAAILAAAVDGGLLLNYSTSRKPTTPIRV